MNRLPPEEQRFHKVSSRTLNKDQLSEELARMEEEGATVFHIRCPLKIERMEDVDAAVEWSKEAVKDKLMADLSLNLSEQEAWDMAEEIGEEARSGLKAQVHKQQTTKDWFNLN